MLAYAFRSLNAGDISHFGNENFDNIHELFSEIIINGMRKQLKRGLPHRYISQTEELSDLRGKIDIQSSIRRQTMIRRRLACEFDEFTEDTAGNRLIKCAVTHLLRQDDVSQKHKHYLKFLRSSLNNVSDVQRIRVSQQRSGGAEYIMLVNVCGFLLDGLLMNAGGGYRMREWLTDDAMSSLYERFLLEYFKRHHVDFNARKAQIEWDIYQAPPQMPKMESDVYLAYNGRTLIIDAKFYSRTMSEHFGKKTYHSNNLYQIFTYVKNADKKKDGSVSGMLLYAKTDEDVTPDSEFIIGGNGISVKTLDLTQNFAGIRTQLEKVATTLRQA
jgi:5-methylcytosine-specific restriction enzyme subunit McrC